MFTSERAGSVDIYRVHPDGSGLERLTDSPSFDDQGSLSPDGRTLAFVSTREGGMRNIWPLDFAHHHAVNLTRSKSGNFRPSWSPDGKWIAFTSDRNTHAGRELPQWELKQLTAVYIVHPDGTGLHRLTPLDQFAGSPKWSSDGNRIVYYQASDIFAVPQIASVDVATGAQQIYTNGDEWKLSPQYIADPRSVTLCGLGWTPHQQGSTRLHFRKARLARRHAKSVMVAGWQDGRVSKKRADGP